MFAFLGLLLSCMKMVCFLQVYSLMLDDRPERKRKGRVKIRMQYGKLITDSRFYKPPK